MAVEKQKGVSKNELSLEESHEDIRARIEELKNQYRSEVNIVEDRGSLVDPEIYVSDIAAQISNQIGELQFISDFLIVELPSEAEDIKSKVRENLQLLSNFDPISRKTGMNREVILQQHYNNYRIIRETSSYIKSVTKIKVSLLKDSLRRNNVDDLMTQSLHHGNDRNPLRANNKNINDIFAEAFLETKTLDWRKNFKLSDYKKDRSFSLDCTKDDFYIILEKACRKMDHETLWYFRDGGITVGLQGEKITMNSEAMSRGGNPDRKYEHIIQMEIDKRARNKENFISKGKNQHTNYINIISEEDTNIKDIPFPSKKPENVRPIFLTQDNAVKITEEFERSQEIPKEQLITEAAEFIISSEGFIDKPDWDNKQWSWGYGTRVPKSKNNKNINPGGKITRKQAKKEMESHIMADYKRINNYFWFEPMTKNQK